MTRFALSLCPSAAGGCLLRLGSIFVLSTLLAVANRSAAAIPAFPGAEGAGALATGGRPNALGGIVYHVTTLDPDPQGIIPGSLRYGMKNENFDVVRPGWPYPHPNPLVPDSFDVIPRIIVFDVGGTIHMGEVDMTPMIFTIAGQTAPGGITLYGGEFNPGHRYSWDEGTPPKVNNLIIRNLSIRTHDPAEKDGLWMPASNSIADHLSLSWYTDEGVSITDAARNVTVQYNIVGPGWNNPDGDGSQIEGKTPGADISVHHNLYLHNDARVPRVGEKEGPGVELDFRNNVICNWNANDAGYSVSGEPSFTNFVNNYYIGGANNDGNDDIFHSGGNLTRIYQSGNLLDLDRDGTADGADLGWAAFTGSKTQQSAPFSVPHGVTQTPGEALHAVMNYAGANWWDRHFLDQRAIDQLQTFGQGTASQTGTVLGVIDPADIAAVAQAPLQVRPAGWDVDNDGMPDYWELQRGLDPAVADWDGDDDGDGYVNLEEYINEIAEWPAPDEIVFTGGAARYAEINNWSITLSNPGEAATTTNWQPSRFDVAVIDNGAATVDAPGQHAGTLRLGSKPGDQAVLDITAGWLKVEDEAAGPGDGALIIGGDAGATATVNLSGGRLVAKSLTKGLGGEFNFTGGTLAVDEVYFDLDVQGGVLAPAVGPGQTKVFGDLALNAGSLEIEIGGTTAQSGFDRIVVTGDVTLSGGLDVSLIDGFHLDAATSLVILDAAGTLSGTFAGLAEGALVGNFGRDLFISYQAGDGNDVALYTLAAIDGDFDHDSDVDGSDFLSWQQGDSASPLSSADLMDWKTSYGAAPGQVASSTNAVPEPATRILSLLAAGAAISRIQRNARIGVPPSDGL